MDRDKLEQLFDQTDQHLRTGQTAAAIKQLKKIVAAKIPRPFLARYCALARRANLPELSLKALKRLVYPKVKGTARAFDMELLEYAVALERIGARRESAHIAGMVDPAAEPRAHLVRASFAVSEWDYAKALPMYDQALGDQRLLGYERTVARVNHLACLGQTGDSRFEKMYSELKEELKRNQLWRLLGNVLEIAAQTQIQTRHFKDAQDTLKEAGRLLKEEASYGSLFVEKWTAFAKAMEAGDPKFLNELRTKALKDSDWETLRHIDLYRTVIEPDGIWSNWVYYGTPFPAFRNMLEKSRQFPEEQWVTREGDAKVQIDPWFVDGEFGDICHRLLVFLLRDFYRPAKIGEIATELFDTRIFDLDVSSNRAHKLLQRFREWLKESKMPFRLDTANGYSLRAAQATAIKCRRRLISVEKTRFIFDRYPVHAQTLTVSEWAETMGISQSRARLLVAGAVDQAVLEKSGSGRYTAYRLK